MPLPNLATLTELSHTHPEIYAQLVEEIAWRVGHTQRKPSTSARHSWRTLIRHE